MTGEAGSYGSGNIAHRLIHIPPSTAAITLKRQLYRHQSTAHELKLWCPASSYWCLDTKKSVWILVGAWSCWYCLGTWLWQKALTHLGLSLMHCDALWEISFSWFAGFTSCLWLLITEAALISAMDNSQWPVWSQRWPEADRNRMEVSGNLPVTAVDGCAVSWI